MRRGAAAIVALAALGAAFLAGAWYSQRRGAGADAPAARRVLYYVDPMHPAYRSDKPGVAPDCGMPLQPIYDEEEGTFTRGTSLSPASIVIDATRQALAGVKVAAVANASRTNHLRLTGRVVEDETRAYRINVGIDGYVREVSAAATTGSRVSKGEWLATMSAPELRTAVQAYLVTLDIVDRSRKAGDSQAQLDIAGAGVQQALDRLLTLGMSVAQTEDIKRTRLLPPHMMITAPAAGFVVARNASVGQRIASGDELYRIADLGTVWVMAVAFGSDVEQLSPGLEVAVSIPGRATSLPARVSRDVPPQFDAGSQASNVRVEVDNPGGVLRPGMFVDIDVTTTGTPAVEVPADAIIDSGLARTVFVERSAGVFEPREVVTGRRAGGRVEIVKGLLHGERVVVAGTFVVDAERRVRGGAAGVQALP
jgi:membrane fusion protein, copper/silver efflux system